MPGKVSPYPAAFRQQMIELVKAGRSPEELAREFGCTAQSIHNWLGKASLGCDGKPSNAASLSIVEREELVRLRREVRRLQMERDILAKATAWFANKDEKTSTPSSS